MLLVKPLNTAVVGLLILLSVSVVNASGLGKLIYLFFRSVDLKDIADNINVGMNRRETEETRK